MLVLNTGMGKFKTYVENDIFGFERNQKEEPLYDDSIDNKPMKQFDVESMIEFLARKKVGVFKPQINYMNEIQWGERAGAIKLEVAPRMSVHVKKLGFDIHGHSRWITKKLFQLNRTGYGGTEDAVASEIHDIIKSVSKTPLESALKDYRGLEGLTEAIANKMRKVAKPMFMFEAIRKLSDENYLIKFSLRGHGLEARDHQQVVENLTQITYDKEAGSIRIMNYKVSNGTGESVNWKIQPNDLDIYFFPSQDRDEIAETVATFFKYY